MKQSLVLRFAFSPLGFALDRLVVRWVGSSWINFATARVMGLNGKGQPVVLLETRGRKTGARRRVVLPRYIIDDKMVIVGSNGGKANDAGWVHNLRHGPDVTVFIDRRRRAVRSRETEGPEREILWAELKRRVELYEAYEQQAGGRRIPVFVLEPA